MAGGPSLDMNGMGEWLSANWWWLALGVALLVVLFIMLCSLGKGAKKTRLQRDALERGRVRPPGFFALSRFLRLF